MPVYVYKCLDCGNDFERLRGISSSDSELACPSCGKEGTAKRKLTTFSAMSKMGGVSRPASSYNSSNGGGCCGGSCGCAD
ncbi:MAG: zinc ribbon domain-containing protein [Chloroflexota bacterium]